MVAVGDEIGSRAWLGNRSAAQLPQRAQEVATEDLVDALRRKTAVQHQLCTKRGSSRHVGMSRGVMIAPSQSLPSAAWSSPTVSTMCAR